MTKIKPCYRRKIALIPLSHLIMKATKFTAHAQYHVTSHPKPYLTIFWPQIVYSLYDFYGATTTIKGSL